MPNSVGTGGAQSFALPRHPTVAGLPVPTPGVSARGAIDGDDGAVFEPGVSARNDQFATAHT